MTKATEQILLTEHEEAVLLADYLDMMQKMGKVILYSHVPNETYTKSWMIKRRNKAEGVHKGVPDYIIIVKHKVLFIELKRTKGSETSIEQRMWVQHLGGKTVEATVAKGFDEAQRFIEDNL
jgi:hypothetical protein